MRRYYVGALAAMLVLSQAAAGQQITRRPAQAADSAHVKARTDFVVRTVPLRHLSSSEAMKLLQPYVKTAGGGVYDISSNIRAVTIRETERTYDEMIVVLNQYDREPATVALNFQLVAGENTTTRDPSVASLDSLLRGVLRFTGYRLLSSSVATASELGMVKQVMAADNESYTLGVMVTDLRVDGNNASVHLSVELTRPTGRVLANGQNVPVNVLSTGVTVPIGQTVVLGTTAVEGAPRALILTVRPQLAPKR